MMKHAMMRHAMTRRAIMTSRLLGCVLLLSALAVPASAQLSFQVNTTPPATISNGGTISFPTTVVGSQASLAVQVTNVGTSNTTISNLSVAGTGFLITPLTLPVTLAPNASATVIVTFAPTQAGTANGSLTINNSTFLLSGTSLGSPLVYTYTAGGSTVTISTSNPSIIFSPVAVGQTANLVFDVRNAGTTPIVISNIGIGQGAGTFTVTGLPPLPVTIAPGADISFTVTVKPTTLGFVNGTLIIDNTSVPIIASGTAPPSLPSYTITVTGTVAPRSQPRVSLTLSQPYPVAIAGTLTITQSGTLPNDPAVQFSSGGQSVPFVIPANGTTALFGGTNTSIAFQTGTVASTITFTPAFMTQAGGLSLTPVSPATLQVTVAPAAPTLVGIQLANETTTGFSVLVTGYTTSRTLTNMNVQFATKPGFVMAQSQITISLQTASNLFFQSNASQTFGGQFTITVPFTFTGTLVSGAPVVSALASVSVNVSNELGTSNTVQATLP